MSNVSNERRLKKKTNETSIRAQKVCGDKYEGSHLEPIEYLITHKQHANCLKLWAWIIFWRINYIVFESNDFLGMHGREWTKYGVYTIRRSFEILSFPFLILAQSIYYGTVRKIISGICRSGFGFCQKKYSTASNASSINQIVSFLRLFSQYTFIKDSMETTRICVIHFVSHQAHKAFEIEI